MSDSAVIAGAHIDSRFIYIPTKRIKKPRRKATALEKPPKKGQKTIFTEHSEGLKPQPEQEQTDFTRYPCPWCLTPNYISRYFKHLKNGKIAKKGQCPACGHMMLIDTIRRVGNYTPEEFAEWVYERGHYGFWHEIKFNEWKQGLTKLGIAQRFWDRYRIVKGRNNPMGDENADYADYLASNNSTENLNSSTQINEVET